MDHSSYISKFTEIINRLQAKECIIIPQHVLESIRFEIKKRNIQPSPYQIRHILRDLDLREYYENIPYILQLID
jgi:hypothetical protein